MTHFARLGAAIAMACAIAPAMAQTPSLQLPYANAGTTASIAPTCLAGTLYDFNRGCSGATNAVPASAGTVLSGAGHAVFAAQGIDTQAQAVAAFGHLGAFAQSVDTAVDAFYNTQSRAASRMTDYIVAANAVGAAQTTYTYTVTVHGALSPLVGSYGSFPYGFADVFVGFNVSSWVFCPSCQGVVANWTSESGKPSDTVYSGSFTMPTGMTFMIGADLDVSSYLNVQTGQSATATADYLHTVTLSLAPVTPGANTVGLSGFDYAAPVPEPSAALLLLAGMGLLARRRLAARR